MAASKLMAVDIVESVSIQRVALVVDFTTGLRERFCFAGKPRRSTWNGYQWSATERELRIKLPGLPKIPAADDAFRILPRQLLVQSSLLDQRILVHKMIWFAQQIKPASVPELLLKNSLSRFREIAFREANKHSLYDFAISMSPPWSPLWIHHFHSGEFVARDLSRRITSMILSGKRDVNIIDALFNISRAFGSPIGYASFFNTLGIRSILDLQPDCGKMLGCVLAGIEYTGAPSEILDKSLNHGIIDNTGLRYVPYSDGMKVDLVINDHSMRRFGLDEVKLYSHNIGSSKWKFMSWCDEDKAKELSKLTGKSRPKLVPIRLSRAKSTSYISLW